MPGLPRILLAVALAALVSCNSDNISWVFVSNPGGGEPIGGGGAVIVIRASGSSAASAGSARWIETFGFDSAGPVTVRLGVGWECAVLEHPRSIELRAPVLSEAALVLPGAIATYPDDGPIALEIRALDARPFDPTIAGPARVVVAASGALLVVEHAGGVVAWGEGQPRYFPAGTSVRTDLGGLFVVLPDGRLQRLVERPAPSAGERIRRPAAGRLEVLGPRGAVIAALPEERCVLHGGLGGLFLTATFPDGLDGSGEPTALVAADGNRYLLRVDGN